MSWALLLLAAAIGRDSIVIIAMSPDGPVPRFHESLQFEVAAREVQRHTGLELQSPEQAGVDHERVASCSAQERFACWVERASARNPAVRYLLILGAPTGESEVALSTLLIDVRAVADLRRSLSSEIGPDELENAIFEEAVTSYAGGVRYQDRLDLQRFFQHLFAETFRDTLAKNGDWKPALDLAPEREAVGAEPSPPPDDSLLNQIVFWSGIGLTTAGAVLVAYAIFRRPSYRPYQLCFAPDCTTEEGSRFAGFSDLSREPGFSPGDEGGGVPIAPLGIGLAGAGLTWSIGAALWDDSSFAWLPVVIGMVLGGASMAVSLLAD